MTESSSMKTVQQGLPYIPPMIEVMRLNMPQSIFEQMSLEGDVIDFADGTSDDDL